MKSLLLVLLTLVLAACSSSDDGGGSPFGGDKGVVAPVGKVITSQSSPLARTLSGNLWCSVEPQFEENDPNQSNPYVIVYSFFPTGKFEASLINVNTKTIEEKVSGQWGATEKVVSFKSADDEGSYTVSHDAEKNEVTLTDVDGKEETEKYFLCGQLQTQD